MAEICYRNGSCYGRSYCMRVVAEWKKPAADLRVAWRPLLTVYCLVILLVPLFSSQSVSAETVTAEFRSEGPALVVDNYSNEYDDIFRYYSSRYFGPFVDWRWFKAQAVAESRLDSAAMSHRGASGLMQLLPSTFHELLEDQPYAGDILDPMVNIFAGMTYNRQLYRKWNRIFNGDDRFLLMFASYNAGFYRVYASFRRADQVRQWGDIKEELPGETRAYVQRIRELMQPLDEPRETVATGNTATSLASLETRPGI